MPSNPLRCGCGCGSAGEVPDLIRELTSDSAQARRKARWALYGTIFHQGTRYQATSYAVPFLLEVLRADEAADRAELLELLAAISVGYGEGVLPDTVSSGSGGWMPTAAPVWSRR